MAGPARERRAWRGGAGARVTVVSLTGEIGARVLSEDLRHAADKVVDLREIADTIARDPPR